jgi:hypothetical protein
MKRPLLILMAGVIFLLLATFCSQNRFLLGMPFVHEGIAEDKVWPILGNRFVEVRVDRKGPPDDTFHEGVYFVRFFSFLFYSIQITTWDHKLQSIDWSKGLAWDRVDFVRISLRNQ